MKVASRVGRRARPLTVALGAALALAVGCEPGMGDTAIFLEVWRLPQTPAPERLLVTWLDGQRVLLRNESVPAREQVNAADSPLATVAFEIAAPGPDLERRVLVLALTGGTVVSRGYERMTVQPGSW